MDIPCRWTGQVGQVGQVVRVDVQWMYHIHWTGGLDRIVGQAWSVRGDVHWIGGLDRTVGQAWSVRVGCPLDRWTGQDSGTSLVSEGGIDIH